jgi:predicted nuclease of predicted toxin-antitoxin system
MRFLVDAQLPPALARWLDERGHTAEHVFERGMAAADDRDIWEYAAESGAAVVTKDEDFALRRVLTDTSRGPQIIWVRRGNTTTRELLRWLEPLLPVVLESLERGEPLVEIA